MTEGEHITADMFYLAFCEQWAQELNIERTAQSPAACMKTWTSFICSRDGFLSRVTSRLSAIDPNLDYRTEWYTVDGLIVGGENTYKKDLAYPSKVYALIEHEQGSDIETEAWKLAHWLAPLKILIFYDWCETFKNTQSRTDFVEKGKERFWSVVTKSRQFFPEPDNTEYLLIVGKQDMPGAPLRWERI